MTVLEEVQNFIPPDETAITFSAYNYMVTEVMTLVARQDNPAGVDHGIFLIDLEEAKELIY